MASPSKRQKTAESAAAAAAAHASLAQLTSDRPQIAILDFGSQFSHLIARRVRELNVFCELYSCEVALDTLRRGNVIGVILSGGPASVYEEGSPHLRTEVWEWLKAEGKALLGICYGMCELSVHFGGEVAKAQKREYGRAHVRKVGGHGTQLGDLFYEIPGDNDVMWMSHGDKLERLPEGFESIAQTDNAPHAAIAGPEGKHIYGLQFHPEVTHSVYGRTLLKNFVVHICKAPTDWNMRDIASEFVKQVRETVGEHGHVVGAVSGGVDSSVAAVLLNRAIGKRFHAIMVDNGCLRKDEGKKVVERLKNKENIDLHLVDASDRFIAALAGVTEPEKKRKIIGNMFIEIFQEEAARIREGLGEGEHLDYLLQGTLYPDVIESISYKGPSATIKTHHNVGGLPEKMHLKLIEPLRELFKDEVRELGLALGLQRESVFRHPFPGPGLAIRILGEVTREGLTKLQHADSILIEELVAANVYYDIAQAFVVLLPVKSVGVQGDGRTYENVVAVRCVTSEDFMTADFFHMDHKLQARIASRIVNEVAGVNRVTYDITSKPPG